MTRDLSLSIHEKEDAYVIKAIRPSEAPGNLNVTQCYNIGYFNQPEHKGDASEQDIDVAVHADVLQRGVQPQRNVRNNSEVWL